MFARVAAFTLVALPLLAAATPLAARGGEPASSCSTGPIQCCNHVQQANDPATSLLLGLLGVVLQGVDAQVGLNCSPLNVIGVGSGNQCNANVVCCENNNVGGLISIGCLPISL